MKSLRLILALIFVSNVALADRKQNDNIDMNGNQIKNADIDGGTASNTSRITAPKNTKSNLDALTRKEGTVVYGTDTGKLYVDNGSLLTPVGSGEGGTGVNAVANPSAATDLTGYSYVGSGSGLARNTTAADLPLYPTVTTGLAITPDMTNDYVAYCGQMPAALKNRKLRFSQFQKPGSGFASGDLKLEIYPSTASDCSSVGTKYVLSKDSSGVTSIPNATQDFWVTFDPDDSDYFQIRWVRVDGTALFVVQNVFIGAGDMPTGPPLSGWTSWTPSFSAGLGSVSLTLAEYARVNDTIYVRGKFTAGTVASSTAFLAFANELSGLTVNAARTPAIVGRWWRDNATASTVKRGVVRQSGATFYFSTDDYTTARSPLGSVPNANAVFASSDVVEFEFSAPIAEWGDSSNVVNYGQQDREYACSTTGTWDAAAAASNTSYGGESFAGCPISGDLSASRAKVVRLQSPIQQGDYIELQINPGGNTGWVPMENYAPFIPLTNVNYGAKYLVTNSTDVTVTFYRYALGGTTYNTDPGYGWSGLGSANWRLKVVRGNALGGFQYATANAAGLVSREASGTATGSFTGARSFSMDFSWARVGKTVTIYWPGNSSSACGSASTFAATGVLPAEARPAADVNAVVIVQDSGAIQADPGRMIINWSTGNITIFKSLTLSNFTGSGNCGIYAGSVSYVAGS